MPLMIGRNLAMTSCAVLTTLAFTGTPPAFAATYNMYTSHIVLNGRPFISPPAFANDGTTYMPIYFVDDVLSTLGIKYSWDGSVHPKLWKLTEPDGGAINLSLNAHTGDMSLYVNGALCEQNVPSIAATPPGGRVATTFVPIWYIQEILRAIGIQNVWNGQPTSRTWSLSTYTAYSKEGNLIGNYLTESDAQRALADYSGGVVKDPSGNVVYTESAFADVDLRFPAPAQVTASAIDQYLAAHPSPLAGLGSTFMTAQASYGVDANYLLSHAIEESGWGTSQIATTKNNLYGYGATDQSNGNAAGVFPSEAYAILFQAYEVRTNYLTPGATNYGGSPTLNGMHQNYASDPNWATKIDNLMEQFALSTNTTVKDYTQYTPNDQAPAPTSTTEPAYLLNGAEGATSAPWQNYPGAPVFADSATGSTNLFTRDLQSGDAGTDVEGLQQALNQVEQAGLTVDGRFGPATQAAVEQVQQANGQPATGVVTYDFWTNVLHVPGPTQLLPAGTQVQVDQIKEGMVGDSVSEWFHVVGRGWVPAASVQFTNVDRLAVSDPTNLTDVKIAVMNPSNPSQQIGTLRAGDTVVVVQPQPQNGFYSVQFVDQTTGQPVAGLVPSQTVSLQP